MVHKVCVCGGVKVWESVKNHCKAGGSVGDRGGRRGVADR